MQIHIRSKPLLARAALVLAACLLLLGTNCITPGTARAASGDSAIWKAAVDASYAAYLKGDAAEAERQLQAALAEAEKFGPKDAKLVETLKHMGVLYLGSERFAQGEAAYQRLLDIRRQQHPRGHLDVAVAQLDVAEACLLQGKFSEAEQILLPAQKTVELKFGKYSPQASFPLLHLGRSYTGLKKYAGAEEALKRALKQAENPESKVSLEKWGDPALSTGRLVRRSYLANYRLVAQILESLAELYKQQGKLDEAEAAYKKTIATMEKRLKPGDPSLAHIYNNFGVFYKQTQQLPEAEAYVRRALEIEELVPDEPLLPRVMTFTTLLKIQSLQKKFGEADGTLKRLVVAANKSLGSELAEAPALARLINTLAKSGSRQTSMSLLQEILLIKRATLGPDNPGLAPFSALAEPFLSQALAALAKISDAEDIRALPLLAALAEINQSMGKPETEQAMRQRMLPIQEKQFGPTHASVINTLEALVPLYRRAGQKAELESAFQRILAAREKELGPEHVDLTNLMNDLADLRIEQGKEAEAAALLRRSLAIDNKVRGESNLAAAATLHKLAQIYTRQGNDKELEPILKQQLAVNEATFGAEHIVLTQDLDAYAKLLRRLQRDDEAAKLEARAAQIRAKAK
ncbi:MAG: tetratricopeptide repeat protein [Verrucomicrobia bacterium]|nr:tetratricopeptide repeat protein [Verrucomicrobiota bacterium]